MGHAMKLEPQASAVCLRPKSLLETMAWYGMAQRFPTILARRALPLTVHFADVNRVLAAVAVYYSDMLQSHAEQPSAPLRATWSVMYFLDCHAMSCPALSCTVL
jgi:hypothetical protein